MTPTKPVVKVLKTSQYRQWPQAMGNLAGVEFDPFATDDENENNDSSIAQPNQHMLSSQRKSTAHSISQSEFEYLQSIFPHVQSKEDIKGLYENAYSEISNNTGTTQNYTAPFINKSHSQLLITASNPSFDQQEGDEGDQIESNNVHVDIKSNTMPFIQPENIAENQHNTHRQRHHSRSISNELLLHTQSDKIGCFCGCITMMFYLLIAIISVCLIFGSLFVDICMATFVYWEHGLLDNEFVKIYFIPCIICIGLTLLSYFLNSCCFFIHTDYCQCAGPCAPIFRCFVSVPGVIYTLMMIPGVHSLPFHMASALCQYVLNLSFMMTNTEDVNIWNWIQLGVGSMHLIFSPMFAWIQQSNSSNLTLCRCIKLMMLWLCSISPLTILELINVFPVFLETFSYNNLEIRTFFILIGWSILIRLIFAFIYVDEDGSRLSLICFKRIGTRKKEKKKRHRKKSKCHFCAWIWRGIGQVILQIFYLALPLLPTAAATVGLYKKGCVDYAKWNHLCVALYLIFTYSPMLYLLLGDDDHSPGAYTWVTIAVAYGCTVWVVLFLPIYLRKWVDFKW